jgi:hypothetical protein
MLQQDPFARQGCVAPPQSKDGSAAGTEYFDSASIPEKKLEMETRHNSATREERFQQSRLETVLESADSANGSRRLPVLQNEPIRY